jgi:beta-lactam-binding protein with PASTA domain
VETPSPEAVAAIVGDYRCLELDEVRARIEDAGLTVGSVLPPEPESDGTWLVIDQEPPADTQVGFGTAIRVWVIEPAQACPG